MRVNKKGFTLLEMLVVVLIIGILAGIAIPQYQMAVTKAKVASILPIMRRWKDALTEYKLQHGDYGNDDDGYPDGADLGVNWPSDWANGECGEAIECRNDYWEICSANDEGTGYVYCLRILDDQGSSFWIMLYQADDPNEENFRNKIVCIGDGDKGRKTCQALGGKLPEGETGIYVLY